MYSSFCPCLKTVLFEWKVLFLPQAISFIALGPSFCVAFVSTASHMNIVQIASRPTVIQTTFPTNNNQTSQMNIDQKTFMMKDIQTTQHIASIDQTTFHMNNNQTTSHMNVAQMTFHMNVAQIALQLHSVHNMMILVPTFHFLFGYHTKCLEIQSNSVKTNSMGPAKLVRYNRVFQLARCVC